MKLRIMKAKAKELIKLIDCYNKSTQKGEVFDLILDIDKTTQDLITAYKEVKE